MKNEQEKVSKQFIHNESLMREYSEYSTSRRNFIAGMITGSIAATFSPFRFLSTSQAQSQPFGVDIHGTMVDVHCHIFNAEDVAMVGFVKSFMKKFPLPKRAIKLLLEDALRLEAPDYVEENERLDQLLRGEVLHGITDDSIESTEDEFKKYLDDLSAQGNDLTELLAKEEKELMAVDMEGIHKIELNEMLFIGLFGRFWKWIRLLKKNRFEIANKLIDTYVDIDLFTPAIIDMDYWLEDKAKTSIGEQIFLYVKIIRLNNGKIHPLVAFDPLREILYSEIPEYTSLYWVKKAIMDRGFIGIKVYPPMGFFLYNNSVHDPGNEFSPKIDKALISLYKWCQEKDVPIMAHCNDSNESQSGYEERANPIYWKEVLNDYPGIRIKFGHFGGADSLMKEDNKDWAETICDLMESEEYPHIYADTGFHEVALDPKKKEKKSISTSLNHCIKNTLS